MCPLNREQTGQNWNDFLMMRFQLSVYSDQSKTCAPSAAAEAAHLLWQQGDPCVRWPDQVSQTYQNHALSCLWSGICGRLLSDSSTQTAAGIEKKMKKGTSWEEKKKKHVPVNTNTNIFVKTFAFPEVGICLLGTWRRLKTLFHVSHSWVHQHPKLDSQPGQEAHDSFEKV